MKNCPRGVRGAWFRDNVILTACLVAQKYNHKNVQTTQPSGSDKSLHEPSGVKFQTLRIRHVVACNWSIKVEEHFDSTCRSRDNSRTTSAINISTYCALPGTLVSVPVSHSMKQTHPSGVASAEIQVCTK